MAVEIVIGANVAQAQKDIGKLKKDVASVGSEAVGTTSTLTTAFSKIGTAVAAAFAVGAVLAFGKAVITAADNVTQLENKLKGLEVPDLAKSLSNINDIARATRSTISDTADLYARIYRSSKEIKLNEAGVAVLTETIQKGFKLSGASAQEAASASLQIGQALSSGVLQGDELRSILENAPVLAQALAKELKVPVGQLRAMGAEGKITSAILANSLIAAADDVGSAFEKTAPTILETFTVAFEQIRNQVGQLFKGGEEAQQRLTDAIKAGFEVISDIIDDLIDYGQRFIKTLEFLYNAADNFFKQLTGGVSIVEVFIGALKVVYRVVQITGEQLLFLGRAVGGVIEAINQAAQGNFKAAGDALRGILIDSEQTGKAIYDIATGSKEAEKAIKKAADQADRLNKPKEQPNKAVDPKLALTNEQIKARLALENKVNSYLGLQDKYLEAIQGFEADTLELVQKKTISEARRQELLTKIKQRAEELRNIEAGDFLKDLEIDATGLGGELQKNIKLLRQIRDLQNAGTLTPEQAAIAMQNAELIKQRELRERAVAIIRAQEDIEGKIAELTNRATPGLREQLEIERQIYDLQQKFPEETARLADLQGEWTKALKYSLSEVGKLEKQFEDGLSGAIYNGLVEGENIFKNFVNVIGRSILKVLTDDISKTITKGVFDGFKNGGDEAQNPISALIKTLSSNFDTVFKEIAAKLAATFSGSSLGGLFGSLFGGGSSAAGAAVVGLPGFAEGGSPPVGRPSIVGEKGPELFIPKTAGDIVSNNALQGQNQATTVTYNINAIDSKSFNQMLAENPQTIYAASVYGQKTFQNSRLRG